MATANYYIMPTKVGPLGSTLDGIKAGMTIQEPWGRKRAYEQCGIQFLMNVWYGEIHDVEFLEKKFIALHDHANMRRHFKTVCTEVFVGDVADYVESVESIIEKHQLDVKYHIGDYDPINKTEHDFFILKNPKPALRLDTNFASALFEFGILKA